MTRHLPVFGSHIEMARSNEGPQHVRVFENGRFLYASWDHGQEQILDIRAHDRVDLLQYWLEWTKPAPSPADARHKRTPERAPDRPVVEYLTSIGRQPVEKKRMTLEEFLVS